MSIQPLILHHPPGHCLTTQPTFRKNLLRSVYEQSPPLPCSLTINSHLLYWELSSISFPHRKIPPQWLLLAITALLLNKVLLYHAFCFPTGSLVKNLSANAGDKGLIPGLGKSLGERNSNPLQYSYLANPWTEEPSRLQSMRLRKNHTWFGD